LLDNTIGGRLLKQQLAPKNRKELQDKMAKVFSGKMKGLSTELQEIFIDDLVTAFESRLTVFNHAQKNKRC
jgi:hypothetical protein